MVFNHEGVPQCTEVTWQRCPLITCQVRTCQYDIFAKMPIHRYLCLPICQYCRYRQTMACTLIWDIQNKGSISCLIKLDAGLVMRAWDFLLPAIYICRLIINTESCVRLLIFFSPSSPNLHRLIETSFNIIFLKIHCNSTRIVVLLQCILRKIKLSNKKLKLCFVYLKFMYRIHDEHQYS